MLTFIDFKSAPQRTFVIGDIHGCAMELQALIEWLEVQVGVSDGDCVVFVGDYIDRGPNSQGVITALIDFKERHPHSVFLRGNHEEMLLQFLYRVGDVADMFPIHGGIKTALSYGVRNLDRPQALREAIPQSHLSFLSSLHHMVVMPDFVIVHAGVDPSVPLFNQEERHLLWIREEWLHVPHTVGRTVVFGHTPFDSVYTDEPDKIGIDTGLVHGNALTCLELTSGETYSVKFGEETVRTGLINRNQ